MNDKLGENPEIMAGVAMSLARERAALREKHEEKQEELGNSGVWTAVVVIAVMVATLALMLFMNAG